ncbi:Fur-regulated basic protein FbpA [Neobacillus sp. SM06]|uniref:Fur-regulated basic protein FbpA n=1 Tax=Neobacillus sp. SM06 TaxID=3422492 RepID=UPI003D2BB8D5
MTNFKSYLREAHDRLKDELIHKLLEAGWTKMTDGRQLYELTLSELVEEYKDTKRYRRIF